MEGALGRQLKLKSVQAWSLRVHLTRQLKLKWVQVVVSWDAQCRQPGRVFGIEASMAWGVLGHSPRRHPVGQLEPELHSGWDILGCFTQEVPWLEPGGPRHST